MSDVQPKRRGIWRDGKFIAEEDLKKENELLAEQTDPDWSRKCSVCEASPVVPVTGMCGPCTFGEADTAGGNW